MHKNTILLGHTTITGSAEGEALCQEREGVPRFLKYLVGRRPTYRDMSGSQIFTLDNAFLLPYTPKQKKRVNDTWARGKGYLHYVTKDPRRDEQRRVTRH
jgi:hypothetical protein